VHFVESVLFSSGKSAIEWTQLLTEVPGPNTFCDKESRTQCALRRQNRFRGTNILVSSIVTRLSKDLRIPYFSFLLKKSSK
jgi:hypothetical protein